MVIIMLSMPMMMTTTTTNKNLQEPAYNDVNWNVPLNSNFTTLDQALGNVTTLTVTGLSGTQALSSAQYIPFALNITGTLSPRISFRITPDIVRESATEIGRAHV